MRAHVFYYKWPRIQEGLEHEEHIDPLMLETIEAPKDAYIFYRHRWYMRGSLPYKPAFLRSAQLPITHFEISADKVPKQIRIMALILPT